MLREITHHSYFPKSIEGNDFGMRRALKESNLSVQLRVEGNFDEFTGWKVICIERSRRKDWEVALAQTKSWWTNSVGKKSRHPFSVAF